LVILLAVTVSQGCMGTAPHRDTESGGSGEEGGSGGTPTPVTGGKPASSGGTGGAGTTGGGGSGGRASPDARPPADARPTGDAAPDPDPEPIEDAGPPPDLGRVPEAPPALGEPPVCMRKVPVSDLAGLAAAAAAAKPGDCVTLADGTYAASGAVGIASVGTAQARITITAQTIGGVTISGTGGLRLDSPAAYVTIRGFRFTHSGTMVMGLGTHHCTITRNEFQLGGSGTYLHIQGLDQEVSYNRFQNKTSAGSMVQLDASGRDHAGTQRSYLHHNHFSKHQFTGGNGGECIATWGGFTRAEHNLFEDCDGDPEIITIKASDGIYRDNTFRRSTRGMVTLRYSNRTVIDGNFFFGLKAGLRAYGKDHRITNNYFEGNNGIGIYVSNGAAGGAYIQIERMLIAHNTLVNDSIVPRSGDLPPLTVTLANNIIRKDGGSFASEGAGWQAKWEGNIFWGSATTSIPASGFKKVDPMLTAAGGISHLAAGSPAIDAAVGSYALTDDMDGQPRTGKADVGADEVSTAPVVRRPLNAADVGPMVGL
jgi:hypothetical protein